VGEVSVVVQIEESRGRTEQDASPAGQSPAARVTFSVHDTGIGIKGEDQARLFTEFGRVDSPVVRDRAGTGLGLRLSQKLAELLGGSIELASEFGTGSTFILNLPRA